MTFEFIEEFKLDAFTQEQIRLQLKACFDVEQYNSRIYFKQRAHYRLLLKDRDELIGQMGLDFRSMLLGEDPIQVLGVIDFTISPDYQGKGHGTSMLKELDRIAIEFKENIDFLFLAADTHKIYQNNGYTLLKQNAKWLGINEHETVGLLERETDYLMVKAVGAVKWDSNLTLDMLGYMY